MSVDGNRHVIKQSVCGVSAMKTSMSNIDIHMIMPELTKVVEGAYIKNIYQYGDVFVLKLYQSQGGTVQLLIQPGQRVHLTEFRRVAPRVPPKFATVLRKYLREKKVLSLKQHDLDRIVIMDVGNEEESYKLVAELFGNGNLLLLDPEDSIFVAMKYRKMRDRDIVPKAQYLFPPPRGVDIFSESGHGLRELLMDSKENVVRTLASRLNLDSQSCEEICALAGVQDKMKVSDLQEQELAHIEKGLSEFIQRIRNGVDRPAIVEDLDIDDDEEDQLSEPVAFVPFYHEIFHDMESKSFKTFSRAIDEFFGVSETELEDEVAQSAFEKERQRLQTIIDRQQESIGQLEEKAEKERMNGELIYANFQTVQDVLGTIDSARTGGLTWPEIIDRIEDGKVKGNLTALLIKKIIPSQAEIIVNLHDVDVSLDMRLSAQDNAARAYEQAKKATAKVDGARKQIEKTNQKMKELDTEAIEPATKKIPLKIRKKRWYEKFRWFVSSEGYLVLGGRDAKSNERLAKRHMTPNDVFLHASIHGAPYVIIKVPDLPPDEKTIREAAQFAITFSRAWQDGLSSGDAYWLPPEQVSFTPPSGEYLPTGGVMLYGNKNYVKDVAVELAVGLILEDENAIPMSGPPTAVETQCSAYVRIIPSDDKKGQLVKDVIMHLHNALTDEQKHLLEQIPQEDIMRVLPSGGGKVID
jgi:predicted ribosome quality control (RQC) complex YloA/Tae2 family protein